MTIEEKAKEIILDHDVKRKRGLSHPLSYYIGADFWIMITEMGGDRFDVALIDEFELPDEIVDDCIETRETIIDAVETYLEQTMWED